MTATYDPALATARDRIRLLLGDTQTPDGALLSDETIDAMLALQGGNEPAATAQLATSLITRWGQEPDSVSVDGLSVSWRDRLKAWQGLLERTQASAAETGTAASVAATRLDDPLVGSEYVRPAWWTP